MYAQLHERERYGESILKNAVVMQSKSAYTHLLLLVKTNFHGISVFPLLLLLEFSEFMVFIFICYE